MNPLRGKTVSSDIESISELKAVGGQVERELTLAVVTISEIKQKKISEMQARQRQHWTEVERL